jgi:hypothetical protein
MISCALPNTVALHISRSDENTGLNGFATVRWWYFQIQPTHGRIEKHEVGIVKVDFSFRDLATALVGRTVANENLLLTVDRKLTLEAKEVRNESNGACDRQTRRRSCKVQLPS